MNIRLLNQQLVAQQYNSPADLVAHFGAIQAQDYRLMRWAVAMRLKGAASSMSRHSAAFRKAYDCGQIVRLHLLRCTWQLIAAEDHAWMNALCGPKALQVMKGWMSANKISIPDSEKYHIREFLMEAAHEKGSVTKEDFEEALAQKDIHMDDHRLSYHIRLGELDGVLCSGKLDPKKATYSLVSEKIGKASSTLGNATEMPREEALKRLARKYFQSHAPATLEDFTWWSGLNIGDCRKAIALLGDEIRTENWKGREFYLLESSRTRGCRKGQTLLLPPYDEYLIGYKSRDLVLAPEHAHHAHNNSGIFYPVIVHDGRICGNWRPAGKEHGATFFQDCPACDSIIDNTPGLAENLAAAWEKYRNY